MKLFLRTLRQIAQPTNRLKAHIFLKQFRCFLLQKFFQQTHQRNDLSFRTLPVFSRKSIESQIFHFQFAAAFNAFPNCLRTGFVASNAGESAQLPPTSVAVHDDGDVAVNCFDSGRHLAALYLQFVAERQVAWVANDEIRMTKPKGMPNDQMMKVSFSQFVIVSTFDIGASSFREREVGSVFFKCVASVAQGMRSKNDRLTASGSNAAQRQLCPGQFRDISHILSGSRRKLRELSCRVN